ncbi:hypothetical protein AAFF_G00296610 [Aldrovandia affinis]|uniref:Uncharacterized protein n=1 Tax=Aldrovandia affinis TaxID=143900 RepID=A0AAD7SQ63_9TELE|nr:hypothetical protein AAFF_G00296610 [Aldrovandia affinis]
MRGIFSAFPSPRHAVQRACYCSAPPRSLRRVPSALKWAPAEASHMSECSGRLDPRGAVDRKRARPRPPRGLEPARKRGKLSVVPPTGQWQGGGPSRVEGSDWLGGKTLSAADL